MSNYILYHLCYLYSSSKVLLELKYASSNKMKNMVNAS